MILILVIAILVLPDLLKASRTAQQSRQVRVRQEERARELAERQAVRIQEMGRKKAERDHQIEMKRTQAAAQLEQLASLRGQYIGLAADLEEQISLCWQPDKRSKLLDKQLKMEQRLYNLDLRIAKLWDQAHCA